MECLEGSRANDTTRMELLRQRDEFLAALFEKFIFEYEGLPSASECVLHVIFLIYEAKRKLNNLNRWRSRGNCELSGGSMAP